MSKRNGHVAKSPAHRQAYRKYIETLDYEPTVDDRISFQQTNQTGEDLREGTNARKRPSTPGDALRHHFASHWPTWALALIGIAIVYLLYDSKVASSKISTQLESQGINLQEARSCVRENEKHNQGQDIKIAETGVRLDAIGKTLDETRTEVKELRSDVRSAVEQVNSQQKPLRDK